MDTVENSGDLRNLPEDCILHIFHFLPLKDKLNFEKVCSAWMKLSKTGLYWTFSRLEVKVIDTYRDQIPYKILDTTEFQRTMSKCGHSLKSLYIYFTGLLNNDFQKIVYSFEGVEYLIDEKFRYKDFLDTCIQTCTELRKLEIRKYLSRGCIDLPHARFNGDFLPNKMQDLFLSNQKLVNIHMDCSSGIDVEIIRKLQSVAGVTKNLYLNWFYYMEENLCELLETLNMKLMELTISHHRSIISERLMTAIAIHSSNLETLSFDSFEARPNDVRAMEKLAELKNLRKLAFIHSYEMSDEIIRLMHRGCEKLEQVELNRCYNISDDGLNAVFNDFPKMESVTISNLGAHSIIRNDVQSNVRILKIHGCDISNDELEKISVFQNLEELDLQDLNTMPNEVICSIATGCKKLKLVSISDCWEINGKGISAITAIPNLESCTFCRIHVTSICEGNANTNLKKLSLIHCRDVTEQVLKTISVFTRLENLYVHEDPSICSAMTDTVLCALSSNCNDLKNVTISDCSKVTGSGISVLATTLKKLDSLRLDYLAIRFIVREDGANSNVRNLKISGCENLVESELKMCVRKMPKLESLMCDKKMFSLNKHM